MHYHAIDAQQRYFFLPCHINRKASHDGEYHDVFILLFARFVTAEC